MADTDEIRKLLGQCFFIGFEGPELAPEVTKFITDNAIGGVTLFANNYESPAQVAELANSIQAIRPKNPLFGLDGVPLVIAVDHEGGKVQRFRKPFTRFPEAHAIGDLDSPKLAFEIAEAQAKELRAVGINVVYAPVCDINTNPDNPVIGRRAFGETEERVTKMVSAVVRGFVTNGVQPVAKHFPGHGDTAKDSHFHLPRVKTTLETLRGRELRPFSKVFRSRCSMAMTAHIIVETIDPKLPATLSPKIIQGLLREELRFAGLILSDDMEMKAVADHWGEIDAALMALEAGVNVLLYHTMPFITRVFEPLLAKLTSPEGARALAMLEASANRVLDFKKANFASYRPVYIPEIEAVVGSKEHQDLLKKVEKLIGAEPV
ncbi:MAG: beta-N-acetylhexosaminidase [Deltaproteobacteria bacterium]|nr:beta-N-acetylhexosaminidase [Deltaproteobacteria bacterium]